jgi:putative iron-regulated protein
MKNIQNLFVFLFAFTFFACDKGETPVPTADYSAVLQNLGNDVILNTYKVLDEKNQLLTDAIVALAQNPDATNLEAARQAWRDARKPWEQSEGFLFGPVDQQGIDPSIDSWPVNEPDLVAVLNSSNVLNKVYIDGLSGTLKGSHTIEFLLFGLDANKPLSDFTPRQYEYLVACAESLEGATLQLYNAWKPDQQNFIGNVLNAGMAGNTVYPSQKSALQEIIIGLVTIADEVANGKINDPFVQKNLTLEESRFSANSKNDFADNIRSIQNAYLGTFQNSTGLGLTNIIAEKNSVLDTKTKQQIEAAIQAIEAIEGTFTTAIFDAPASVENAQQKVRDLQLTLESEVLPIISNL